MAASPGPGRRGLSHATYQRRRIIAGGIGLAVLVVLVIGLLDGGGIVTDAPQSADEVIERHRERNPVRLTVSVSGDLLIHSPVYERAQAIAGGDGYDFAPMFKQVRPYVRDADLAFCHVEVPMTSAPPASFPIFNTPPELADAIAKTGWEACGTASNHTLDQGQEGIDATLKSLDRAGVEHTGSYASKADSRKILMLGAKGVRVAYLAYTTDTNGIPVPKPWSLNVAEKPDGVIADARRARKQGADAVLVNMHWGIDMTPEYVTAASKKQVGFARELADAPDITAVVGQGPHVVQQIDRLGGELVVFSEGNLLSNQSPAAGLPASSQDGMVVVLDCFADGDGTRVTGVRYVPTFVSHPDYTVLPVGSALEAGDGNAGELRSSYQRTVDAAGRGKGVEPDPPKLP